MPLIAYVGAIVSRFFGFFARFITGFWGSLSMFLTFMAPGIVSTVLKLLGIGLVSFLGFYTALDQTKDFLFSRFDNLPSDLFQILSLMKVNVGLSMMFAAMSIALTIKVTTRAASTVVWRKPGSGSGGSMTA